MPPPDAGGCALLLDLGGVVLRNGIELVALMAEREPAVRSEVEAYGGVGSERDELWQRMLRHEVGEREYWSIRSAAIGRALGQAWDTRDLMTAMYERPSSEWLREDALRLMRDVRAAGRPVGALTNDLEAFHGPAWVAEQDWLRGFDVIVDGSVTGILKPDPRAFALAVEELGVPAGDIVFLDDMPWNVDGGRAAGLQVVPVSHQDPEAAFEAARQLLGVAARAA